MGDTLEEVMSAVERQGLTATVRALPDARSLFDRALARFTQGQDVRWWWEFLPESTIFHEFPEDDGFRYLLDVVPEPDEPVYFILEDDEDAFFPVLHATARAAQALIGDSFGFEYYLVHPSFTWIVGENHHSSLFAFGEPVAGNLARLEPAAQRSVAPDRRSE